MRRMISILTVILCVNMAVFANDDGSNEPRYGGIGIQSSYRTDYIRIGYSRDAYKGFPTYGVRAIDAFHLIEWEGQFELLPRLRGRVTIPYQRNVRKNIHEISSYTGLSDLKFTGIYDVIDRRWAGTSGILGSIGFGVNVPTGSFDQSVYVEGYPEQFNVGMGSWSLRIEPALQLKTSKGGMIIQGNYMTYSMTDYGYSYGDQWNVKTTVFRALDVNKGWTFIPMGGWVYDERQLDRGTDGKGHVGASGFYSHMALGGLTVKYTRFALSTRIYFPVSGQYPEDIQGVANRIDVQLIYSIQSN